MKRACSLQTQTRMKQSSALANIHMRSRWLSRTIRP